MASQTRPNPFYVYMADSIHLSLEKMISSHKEKDKESGSQRKVSWYNGDFEHLYAIIVEQVHSLIIKLMYSKNHVMYKFQNFKGGKQFVGAEMFTFEGFFGVEGYHCRQMYNSASLDSSVSTRKIWSTDDLQE